MMAPIVSNRFDVGIRVAKKIATAKDRGRSVHRNRIAAIAAAEQPARAATAFRSAQLPPLQLKKGMAFEPQPPDSLAGHTSSPKCRPITPAAVMRPVQKPAPKSGLSQKG